jgi:hypothetical protein
MPAMTLARRILAVVVAALQLTLPLAAYARTPFVPGAGDICTAARTPGGHSRAPAQRPPVAPLHDHASSHCALCAHGAPPALPTAAMAIAPVDAAPVVAANAAGCTVTTLAHSRADARAPPAPPIRSA